MAPTGKGTGEKRAPGDAVSTHSLKATGVSAAWGRAKLHTHSPERGLFRGPAGERLRT